MGIRTEKNIYVLSQSLLNKKKGRRNGKNIVNKIKVDM